MGQNTIELVDKEKQIRNSTLYLLPVIVSSFLPFLTLPVFTRILSKEDFGILALAGVFAIFVNGLAHFGMQSAYNRNYFQYRHKHIESAQLLYSTLIFVILNYIILAFLTYIFKSTFSRIITGSDEYGSFLFWAMSAQFFSGINYYYLTYFKNSEDAKNFTIYTISISVISFFFSLFLVAYLRIGIIGLVYAQFVAGILIFATLSYKFTTSITPSLSKGIFIESLKIGYPLTPRIFLGVISTQFDKYMIGLFATVGGVGFYSIGQKVAYQVFNFMTAIQNVFSPQVYKRMFDLDEKGGEEVGRYLTPFVYVCIAIALMIALFSEEIIRLLTPKSYHEAINVVTILSMFYGSMFFGKQPQLIFVKKTHITSLLTLMGLIINVILNIPFILKWGAMGAAWATFIAGIISGLISFLVSQRYYEIKWQYKNIGVIFLIFFLSSILMILLRNNFVYYEIRLMTKLLALIIYVYIGVKLKVITTENLSLLKSLFFNFKKTRVIT